MARTRIDEMRHAELADAAQTLQKGAVEQQYLAGEELDGPPNGIIERLGETRKVSAIELAQNRRDPLSRQLLDERNQVGSYGAKLDSKISCRHKHLQYAQPTGGSHFGNY